MALLTSLDSKTFPATAEAPKISPKESRVTAITESLLSAALTKMNIGKCETILDFGCGTGYRTNKFLAPIAEATDSKVFAVDTSLKMIQYAQEHYKHSNVYYICGDVTAKNFPLVGIRFNKIICSFVLEYVADYGYVE